MVDSQGFTPGRTGRLEAQGCWRQKHLLTLPFFGWCWGHQLTLSAVYTIIFYQSIDRSIYLSMKVNKMKYVCLELSWYVVQCVMHCNAMLCNTVWCNATSGNATVMQWYGFAWYHMVHIVVIWFPTLNTTSPLDGSPQKRSSVHARPVHSL